MKIFAVLVVFIYLEYASCFEHIENSLGSDIQDFINLLPVDDILALGVRYEKTDVQFQDLINHIKSKEFFNFLDQLTSSPEYRKLSKYLEDNSITERKILQSSINKVKYGRSLIIEDIPHFGRSYNQLELKKYGRSFNINDMTRVGRSYNQFVDPLERYRAIFNKDNPTDPRLRRSYNQLIDQWEKDGENWNLRDETIRFGRSYNQFIDRLETLIPVERARLLFKRKIETSPKFRHFYNVISKREFLDLVDKVLQLDFAQEELKKIRELGVNLKRLARVYEEIFGLPETFSTLHSL